MKTIIKKTILLLTLALLAENFLCKSTNSHKTHKKTKYTPKAVDLDNHFGSPQIGSNYGPVNKDYENYVTRNPEVFTPQRFNGWKNVEKNLEFKPYPGYENKLNPHHIKSGDLTNVAPSASSLVNPQIAGPKLNIQAEINYPAHVKTPTFYGFRKELHPITAYDKVEGKIVHDNVLLSKPLYGWEDKVSNIKREINQSINLNNGELIKQNTDLVNHGVEVVEETPKKCHGKNRRLRRRI